MNDSCKMFSANEISLFCNVVHQTAINWIRSGKLKAHETPGGQFRVSADELAEFLSLKNLAVPDEVLKHCSKRWYSEKNVLLIEEDAGLSSVIYGYLKKNIPDLNLCAAYNVFEAGILTEEIRPAVVIIDTNLSGFDGMKIVRKIQAEKKYRNPEVIVLGSISDNIIEEKELSFENLKVMEKPLDLKKICEYVRKFFEG